MAVCLPAAALQVIALDVNGAGGPAHIDELYFDGTDATANVPEIIGLDGPAGARSFAGGVRPIDFGAAVSQGAQDNVTVGTVAPGAGSDDSGLVSAIPEPGTSALLLAGLVAMGFIWRRRRG